MKLFIAGHNGMVGGALVRRFSREQGTTLLLRTRRELDLTSQLAVEAFYEAEKPDVAIIAAAKVGGIHANAAFPAEFIRENLAIELNVIDAARRHGVKKLLFLGSSCIYPKHAPQPMKEEHLLTGPLEPTNEPYAIAKIAGLKLCAACNRQYGTDFLCVMPTNLYGTGDHYDLENSHVLPALIRKMHEAKAALAPEVVVWGTGTPRREFLHADDLADACVFLMEKHSAADIGECINIGCGEDLTIRELAALVAQAVGYSGALRFDTTRPDGTPRKLLDVSRMTALGWRPRMPLAEGIASAYADYRAQRSAQEHGVAA
jgi:GDP-L-fucose synthase